MDDRSYMERALELARRGTGQASPNPLVGALVVRDGDVIAEGWHERCGAPHAEAMALGKAGDRARGATLYCTLEPCCHNTPGKRTPPCTDAIIRAGVARVVCATLDPNPLVSGGGVKKLEDAGIQVEVGVDAVEARKLNEPFFVWVRERRPFVHMKVAQTMDGRIAAASGDSQWVTGIEARTEVHRLRASCDAVLIGSGTVFSDDPSLTVRHVEGRNPIRVILDSELRTPPEARVVTDGAAPTIIAHAARDAGAADRAAALERPGVETVQLDSYGGIADLSGRDRPARGEPAEEPARFKRVTASAVPAASGMSGSGTGRNAGFSSERPRGAEASRAPESPRAPEPSRTSEPPGEPERPRAARPGLDTGGRVAIEELLDVLGARDITSVLVEGGATVFTSFLAAGCVDRLSVFFAPKVLGAGISAIGDLGARAMSDARELVYSEVRRFGEDLLVTGLFDPDRIYDGLGPVRKVETHVYGTH